MIRRTDFIRDGHAEHISGGLVQGLSRSWEEAASVEHLQCARFVLIIAQNYGVKRPSLHPNAPEQEEADTMCWNNSEGM